MTTWKPIIAGIDASAESAWAASFAWQLARRARTECRLVHGTTQVSDIPKFLHHEELDLDELIDHLTVRARKALEDQLRGNVPPGALGSLEVRLDKPIWALKHAIEAHHAGLLVLGGKHHLGLARWVGGSTAHHAARTLDVPVMVTGAARRSVARVLAAVDLSHAANEVLDQARRIAKVFEAELRVLHAIEPITMITELPLGVDHREYERKATEAFDSLLTAACIGEVPRRVTRMADPVHAITDVTKEWMADIVVIGSHGKNWVDRVLIGSTTERLLNKLPTSLLVVPVGAPTAGARAAHSAGRASASTV